MTWELDPFFFQSTLILYKPQDERENEETRNSSFVQIIYCIRKLFSRNTMLY